MRSLCSAVGLTLALRCFEFMTEEILAKMKKVNGKTSKVLLKFLRI